MEFDKNPRETARRMIIDGVALKKVARMTGLSLEVLKELAATEHLSNVPTPQNSHQEKSPRPVLP